MGDACDYVVTYTYLEATSEVEFIVQSKVMANHWTGVGFSTSGAMVRCKFIYNEKRKLKDNCDLL